MSAIPEDFINETTRLSEDVTGPFPNSRKIYVEGSHPGVSVPMREISQDVTHAFDGDEENPPIYVYDTSGPYTDPTATIDLLKGLPPLRDPWIEGRGDTEKLSGPSSEFGQERQSDPELAHFRFEHIRTPRRAKAGANVTQMHYARQGIITPEMEFVAIRENMKLDELRRDPRYAALLKQHPGQSFGANLPEEITPEFVRDEVA
ncbi:MAG TPA: phosphomethylpyrimidine synthase ThiC, partial [Chromatiaceae bacterium]|nr:phosphomethylpyrimidine synthase ThiC [Chromatiaceae bacterium]